MIRHLVRLIWNRKRSSALIMIEICCAFLVVEVVMLMAAHYANNYRQPLGFAIDRVWTIDIGIRERAAPIPSQQATLAALLQTLHDLPEIESSCGAFTAPYTGASWGSDFRVQGRAIDHRVNRVTDDCGVVLGLSVTRGRWFSKQDDGVAWMPIVVNERFAREVFGDADPIGRDVPQDPDPRRDRARAAQGQQPEKAMRVIGVMPEFRQSGEYSMPESYIFRRYDPTNTASDYIDIPRLLLIKVRAGTPLAFEEHLVRQLQSVARDWSFEVTPLDTLREDFLRFYTAPLLAFGVLAAFLLSMVALGLTGVVWQNVTQRIREIGLRRAKGARIEQIHQQILGELVVMTSLALIAGVLLVAQVPLLPVPPWLIRISPGVFILSIVLSALAIYLLTIACGWYPARLATKIQPAEALHYE